MRPKLNRICHSQFKKMQNNTIAGNLAVAAFLLQLILMIKAQQPQQVATTAMPPELNITTSTDDYVRQNQYQYNANIVHMDAQLAASKKNYESKLGTITTQNELLLIKLRNNENQLHSLELLNDLNKHCVQKYSEVLPAASAAQQGLSNCVQTALNSYNSYASAATSTRNTLNNYYNINLLNALNQCKKHNPNPSLNYTKCVQAINAADAATATNIGNFNTQMRNCHCSAEGRVKQAVGCSLTIVNDAVSTVGQTNGLIDNCINDVSHCPACEPQSDDPTSGGTLCSNQLTLSLNAADYQNATIRNPFYGYNGNMTCILIHFVNPI